jgi:hypothetical protein
MVTKEQLGVEKEFPPKTHKFLCNASHMPSHIGPDTPPSHSSVPYICANHSTSTIKNQAAVDDEEEFEGAARLQFQRIA